MPAPRVVRKFGAAELAPLRDPQSLLERQAQREARAFAARQREEVVVPVRVIPERDPGHVVRRERLYLRLDRVVAPLRIAGDEHRVGDAREVVDGVLLEVGGSVLVSGYPAVQVADRIFPGAERHAAVREVVVFLNGGVELPQRARQPARWKAGEVVAEE